MNKLDKQIKDCIQTGVTIGEELLEEREESAQILDTWKNKSEKNQSLYDEVTNPDFLWKNHLFYDSVGAQKDWKAFEQKKNRRLWRHRMFAVAASCLLLMSVGVVYYFQTHLAEQQVLPLAVVKEANRQVLLIQGEGNLQVQLEDGVGMVICDGEMRGNKEVQGLVYEQRKQELGSAMERTENRLIVPRGKTYSLTLEDGTRIWMNAESELIYTVPFDENERTIELKGEGYFEVAKDSDRPFRVKIRGLEVVVTGTAFNIKAYENENQLDVALVEGGVHVIADEQQLAELKPLQQFEMEVKEKTYKVRKFNLTEVLAWRNNLIVFKDKPLELILGELARWYDVEFSISDALVGKKYSGSISKDESLDAVFDILRLTNEIEIIMKSEREIEIIPKK